ncbi:SIMPL domain-containing protein [Cetobacterium sp. 8H]|uniref:SIMPL domain-containing protein n=1 Tax=Cetobacterium sp. 8H TaxID=2759681 RepID=UPI00163BA72C|nr:SIMPL domain-containing protein [Cetobacterium sp. 8H]MBC2851805.1 SIMPL domain-containing protein [Cetobacterium sp. 8H]
MKKTIGAISIFLSTMCLAKDAPTISVVGNGTISAKPDTLSIIATVETINLNSEKAISENTAIINNAIKLLKKEGLKDKNIKTENYSLNYRSDYNNKDNDMKYYVRNQIVITSEDLENTSKILTALNSGGVNNIGEVNFYVADRKELEDKAYVLAYEDAKSKAQLIAGIDKFTITPKDINLSFSAPRPVGYMLSANSKMGDAPIPVTVPNNVDVTASMNVTFYMEK